jgi:hypothetical protein
MNLRGFAEDLDGFGVLWQKTCGNYGRAGYADLYEKESSQATARFPSYSSYHQGYGADHRKKCIRGLD